MNNTKLMNKGLVTINGNKFVVSLAINQDEQEEGLMYISPPLTSMAFIYTLPQINKFWMKNVKADLDVLFCYKGKIIEIIKANAMSDEVFGENQYSDLVLEFPSSIGDEFDFQIGDDVKMSFTKEAALKILSV